MTGLKQRLAKMEARKVEREFKPAMSFLWASPDDDAALEEACRQAEAEDRLIFINRISPPYQSGEDHGIKTGVQGNG